MDSKLTSAIDELVEKRTFGLDALGAIKGLRDKAIEQDSRIDELRLRIEQRDTTIGGLRHEKTQLEAEIATHRARETDLASREAKVREIELREAAATAKASALGDVFQTIFRNVTVRETAVRQLPFRTTQQGGYAHEGYQAASEQVELISE